MMSTTTQLVPELLLQLYGDARSNANPLRKVGSAIQQSVR